MMLMLFTHASIVDLHGRYWGYGVCVNCGAQSRNGLFCSQAHIKSYWNGRTGSGSCSKTVTCTVCGGDGIVTTETTCEHGYKHHHRHCKHYNECDFTSHAVNG